MDKKNLYCKRIQIHSLAWLTFIFTGLLTCFHIAIKETSFQLMNHYSWVKAGALDHISFILYNQWYRLITSLTLHSNLDHLAGNLLFGSIFLYLTARKIGFGMSIFFSLLCASTGNYLSILIHPYPIASLGLSTFVFSNIGIFSTTLEKDGINKRGIFLNLAAAISFMALIGTQGENTDYQAHICSLGTGLIGGWFLSYYNCLHLNQKMQYILYYSSYILLFFSWICALVL